MQCLSCGAQNPPGAKSCERCHRPLPVYGAPEGFAYDLERGLYRRDDAGGALFFDPVGGEYFREEDSGAPVEPADTGTDVSALDHMQSTFVQPRPLTGAEPSAPPPEGFELDPASGLYCRVDDAGNEDGEQVCYVTWYDPALREYAQARYAAPDAEAPDGEPRAAKRKTLWIVASAAALVILLFAGWLLWGESILGEPAASSGGTSASDASDAPDASDAQASDASHAPSAAAVSPENASDAEALSWTEPLIEQAVREYIGKPDGAIVREDLEDIITVFMYGDTVAFNPGNEPPGEEFGEGSIASLEDMRNFPALKEVIATNNPISDLSPLAGIETLYQVMVFGGGITDVSPMATLPGLGALFLDDNLIADIAPLAECKMLDYVLLARNQITDASPLSDLPLLEILDLAGNPIEDWSVVAHIEDLRGAPKEAPTPEPTAAPTPEPTAEPTPDPTATPRPTSESQAGEILFDRIFTADDLPPGEGVLSVQSFRATSNGRGGYDVEVEIRNETDYLWQTSIHAVLIYGPDAYSHSLAEDIWFEKGASQTFTFEVPADMVANGDCRVRIEYTFF